MYVQAQTLWYNILKIIKMKTIKCIPLKRTNKMYTVQINQLY